MADTYKTVILNDNDGQSTSEEGIISGTPLPGMLAEITSAANKTFVAHATDGGKALPSFFVEDDKQGKETKTAYTAGALGFVRTFQTGHYVAGRIANGENIAKGDLLVSNGDGYLRKLDEASSAGELPEEHVIGKAQDAVDMSDSSAADPNDMCKVQVL